MIGTKPSRIREAAVVCHAAGGEHVLERNRDPRQRRGVAAAQPLVGRAGLGERLLARHRDVGVEPPVLSLDAVERRCGERACAILAPTQRRGVGVRRPVEIDDRDVLGHGAA